MSAVDRYAFPGRRISVAGGSVHVVASGTGSPTVVFESGMGGNLLDWTAVATALPSTVHVLAYDRAGLGWSDPRPGPRTPGRIVDELETILGAAGADPPYVFVAHSMGARYARLFTARPSGRCRRASFITARLRLWRFVGLLARVGVVRLLGGRLESLLGRDYRHMPEAERARYVAMLAERRALTVAGDELRHGGDSSDALRSASLGDSHWSSSPMACRSEMRCKNRRGKEAKWRWRLDRVGAVLFGQRGPPTR